MNANGYENIQHRNTGIYCSGNVVEGFEFGNESPIKVEKQTRKTRVAHDD
jgi:hypothetical protein